MIPHQNKKKNKYQSRDFKLIGVLKIKTAYEQVMEDTKICLFCFKDRKQVETGLCKYCSQLFRRGFIIRRGNCWLWSPRKNPKDAPKRPDPPLFETRVKGDALIDKMEKPMILYSGRRCRGCSKIFPWKGLIRQRCILCSIKRDRLKRVVKLFEKHNKPTGFTIKPRVFDRFNVP